jgi:prepilin-type N-terminal cleavage/methylation domain-containing protein
VRIRRSHKLGAQRGDTIVEVMVVLAVLGLALGVSYATANASLNNSRQAEESAQATAHVQSEIESLRYLGPSGTTTTTDVHYHDNDNIYSKTKAFCVPSTAGASGTLVQYPTDNIATSPCGDGNLYSWIIYNCDLPDTGGTSFDANWKSICSDSGIYNANPSKRTDTFVVQVSWPDLGGGGTDTVTQAYRIHPQ